MTSELIAFLRDAEVGRLRRDRQGRLTFRYEETWRRSGDAYPLSLSMPLALAEHGHATVDAYLWGLLPDNEIIIERWARRFQVSARNAFALIAQVGEDCAGAIRFARPERAGEMAADGHGEVDWLDEKDLAARLRELLTDASAWRRETDSGQFSLAGAQPKTALLFNGKRWGVPSGRIPTTHILKPGTPDLDGHSENEHFCLSLARELGLPTARSRVARFEDQVAIVVERYDRLTTPSGIVRVHQEDVCQALAVHPVNKYESDGGPGVRAVVDLLREHSQAAEEDLGTFIDALAFNWLIAGTDAHGKNYSLLIGSQGRARLAPLYDVASALPYAGTQVPRLKLAMKIGSKYRVREIGLRQWGKLASEVAMTTDRVESAVRRMAAALPDLAGDVLRRSRAQGLDHRALDGLAKALRERAKRCVV